MPSAATAGEAINPTPMSVELARSCFFTTYPRDANTADAPQRTLRSQPDHSGEAGREPSTLL
jgi:hypothetical protein